MNPVNPVTVGEIAIGGGRPFALIAGPCVIESEAHASAMAAAIQEIARRVGVPFVFKASYDKANRTSGRSFRGPGLSEGLRVLAAIKARYRVPILTDIHEPAQAAPKGRHCAGFAVAALVGLDHRSLVVRAIAGVVRG